MAFVPKGPGEYTPCATSTPLVRPTIAHVTTQPITVFPHIHRLTPARPSKSPTPTVAPTWQCVVDNGRPNRLPMIITKAEPNSMAVPLEGVILHNLLPIACVILYPFLSNSPA